MRLPLNRRIPVLLLAALAGLGPFPGHSAPEEGPVPQRPKDWEEVKTPEERYDNALKDVAEVFTPPFDYLLVWVVDQSISMQDDVAEVRKRVEALHREVDRGRGRLSMAVVAFGAKPMELLGVTRDPKPVMEALARIPPDPSGQENCMEALRFSLRLYHADERRIVLVLLTDETGNDTKDAEGTLRALQASEDSLCCLGRESPFLSVTDRESLGDVDAGPDSAELEGLWLLTDPLMTSRTRNQPAQAVPSGFGTYALSRLCRASGGRYYPFRSGTLKDSKARYDRPAMDRDYAPDLCSENEYGRLVSESALRRAIQGALKAVRDVPCPDPMSSGCRSLASWLKPLLKQSERRRQRLDGALKALGQARGYEDSRRVLANAGLLEAQLRLEIYEHRCLEKSILDILAKSPPALKAGQTALLSPREGPLDYPVETLREEALDSFHDLERKHPGTPWAATGRDYLDKIRPHRWVLEVQDPPPPYRMPPPPPPGPPPPPSPPLPRP
jgi:hypothetical protein